MTSERIQTIAQHNASGLIDRLTRQGQYAICRSYADRWLAGERWSPIVLGGDDKVGWFHIADGFHRTAAAIMLGHTHIDALHMRPVVGGGNGWQW